MLSWTAVFYAVWLLSMLWGSPAISQTTAAVTCKVSSLPSTVLAEGISETAADVVLTCTAEPTVTPQIQPNLVIDVLVALNVSVTNFSRGENRNRLTDAVLVVNGNNCSSISDTGSSFGSCNLAPSYVQDPQYGELQAVNKLRWSSVSLPFPGAFPSSNASEANPQSTTLQLGGIRGNASQLRIFASSPVAAAPMVASVSIRAQTAVAVQNSQVPVAYPAAGLLLEPVDPLSASFCLSEGHSESVIHVQEGFASAFKTEPFTEQNSLSDIDSAGFVKLPTRILLEFKDIPSGVSISLPQNLACHQPRHDSSGSTLSDVLSIGLVRGHGPDGNGGQVSSQGSATTNTEVALSTGQGSAVYEVLAHDSFQVEDCHIPVVIEANEVLTSQGQGRVAVSLAPRGLVLDSDENLSPSGFVSAIVATESSLDFAACSTVLIFPFVTNQAGFDTGLVITHSSPVSTRAFTGSCDLHYYGTSQATGLFQTVQKTNQVSVGGQLVFTLSGGNADQNIQGTEQFEGYVMAVCGFPGARGYAFISDGFGGSADLAMGYFANTVVIAPDGRRLVSELNSGSRLFRRAQ